MINKNHNHNEQPIGTERPYRVINHDVTSIGRFVVVRDTICINGSEYPYSYAASGDSVVVLPIFEGKVVLIKEYRHTIDKWMWSFPGGGVNLNENNPLESAKRELYEETGFISDDLNYYGKYPVSPGVSNDMVYFYLANCAKRDDVLSEPTEFIKVEVVSDFVVDKMIDSGEFVFLAGIVLWNKYKRQKENEDIN